jgi:hypothetical protein
MPQLSHRVRLGDWSRYGTLPARNADALNLVPCAVLRRPCAAIRNVVDSLSFINPTET